MPSISAVDEKTGRKFYLDDPDDLSPGEKVVFLLNLHGGGSVGNWQREYFPAYLLKDRSRLVVATPSAATKEPMRRGARRHRRLEQNADIFRFFKLMIAFRKFHPSIARGRFWRQDIRCDGVSPESDLGADSKALAYYLLGESEGDCGGRGCAWLDKPTSGLAAA